MDIKCDIIVDLLPSYVDGLTSESSNELINEHLSICESCREIYEDMIKELPEISEKNKDISESSEIKLMKRIKSRMVTIITTVIVTFSILGFILGVYGKVIFQEGNPMPLISSIIKLEFTDAKYVRYSSAPEKYISYTKDEEGTYKVVKDFMIEKGWTFKEQMGAGLVFEKNEEIMVIETRQYTRNYFIWSIPKEVTKIQ